MREVLRKVTLALAATTVCSIAVSGAARAEDTLTIVSWGGAYSESQAKAYDEPFTKKFGINVVHEDKAANGLAGIRAQEQAGNVTWDVVDMLEGPALRACDEGLIEPIDYDSILAKAPDGTPPTEDFIEGSLSGCFIPEIVYATLFAYNETAFPNEKPSTVKDVFNLEKFPGKRALQKIPAGNLEWALVADGVPYGEVYDVLSTDEGVNRAFAKLDTIKDHVVWWEEGAQPPQLLADKEVVIATGYNGRFFNAAENEGQPIKIIWDGQLFEIDGWVVPTGQLTENVKKYLHFATDTQRLADQAKYISYGPARASSNPLVPVNMQPHMPTNPDNFQTPIKKDAEWWADNGDSMSERFNAWLAR